MPRKNSPRNKRGSIRPEEILGDYQETTVVKEIQSMEKKNRKNMKS